MSRLLLDDKPLIILPSLATKIGLNESIVLQQLHYWLQRSDKVEDGHKWVYNTYEEWQKQFPFWSVSTIRRTINKLEESGLIISGNYNRWKMDKTKWYRIDHEKMESLEKASVQNEQSNNSNWTEVDVVKMNRAIPERENTTEITINKTSAKAELLKNNFDSFWSIYPKKTDKKKALNSFKTAIKNHPIETILTGTKSYATHIKQSKIESQYIKHATTFLNNESFLNEYEPIKKEVDALGYDISQYKNIF